MRNLLLEDGTSFHICEIVNMAGEVKKLVGEMLAELCWEEDRAKEYVEDWKRNGRLQEDEWA